MELTEFGEAKLPSVVKDPFSKTKIDSIYVEFSRNIFDKERFSASGRVKFKNGDTQGIQKFEGATFDEVVIKIKAMLDSMKN